VSHRAAESIKYRVEQLLEIQSSITHAANGGQNNKARQNRVEVPVHRLAAQRCQPA
jgi:hypothetical protein